MGAGRYEQRWVNQVTPLWRGRQNVPKYAWSKFEDDTNSASDGEAIDTSHNIGVFRQLDSGKLVPVGARHSKEEAQTLIASLEKVMGGQYVIRELQIA